MASALFDLPIGDEEDRKPGGPPPGGLVSAFSNIEMAPIITIESGHAVNPLTGADDLAMHSWPLTSRPPGLARNSVRTPASANVDLRILKFFNVPPHGKLDLVIEAFNLLNRANWTSYDGVQSSTTFGRPLSAAAARQIQIGARVSF